MKKYFSIFGAILALCWTVNVSAQTLLYDAAFNGSIFGKVAGSQSYNLNLNGNEVVEGIAVIGSSNGISINISPNLSNNTGFTTLIDVTDVPTTANAPLIEYTLSGVTGGYGLRRLSSSNKIEGYWVNATYPSASHADFTPSNNSVDDAGIFSYAFFGSNTNQPSVKGSKGYFNGDPVFYLQGLAFTNSNPLTQIVIGKKTSGTTIESSTGMKIRRIQIYQGQLTTAQIQAAETAIKQTPPSLHTATLSTGANDISTLAFAPALPSDLSAATIEITGVAGATLNINQAIAPKYLNLLGEAKITLSNTSNISSSTIIAATAPLEVSVTSITNDLSLVTFYSGAYIPNFFAAPLFNAASTFANSITLTSPSLSRRYTLTYINTSNSALARTVVMSPAKSINLSFGGTISGTANSGAFPVVRDHWNNQTATANNTTTLSKGANADGSAWSISGTPVTSTIGDISGTWQHTMTDPIFYQYLDENATKPAPSYTITNIPFAKYRVISYSNTDTDNYGFGYVTINGVNYNSSNNLKTTADYTRGYTTKGTGRWGRSKVTTGLPTEGVNYIVSDIIEASTLTVIGHRIDAENARGCLSAVQIIEVVDRDARAVLGAYLNANSSWVNQIGTKHGQIIPNTATAAFLTAHSAATTAYENASLTESEYDIAYFNLLDAVALIAIQPRNTTLEKDTKWYFIQSTLPAHNYQSLYTNMSSTNVNFGNKPAQLTLNYLFKMVSTTGANFRMTNAMFASTGGLNQAVNDGNAYAYTTTAPNLVGSTTTINVGTGYPQFGIFMGNSNLHAQSSGAILVRWNPATPAADNASAWRFEEFDGDINSLIAPTIALLKSKYDLYVDQSGNAVAAYPLGTEAFQYSQAKFDELKSAWSALSVSTTYEDYCNNFTAFDDACAVFLGSKNPPIALDTYYYIKPYQQGGRAWITPGTTTLVGGGAEQPTYAQAADANNLKHAWKLIRHSSFKGSVFQNAYTGEFLNTTPTDGFKNGSAVEVPGMLFTSSATAHTFGGAINCFYLSSVSNSNAYLHISNNANNALFIWVGANLTDNCVWKFEEFEFTAQPLLDAITAAQEEHNNAPVGDNTGEYSNTNMDIYNNAIGNAILTSSSATSLEEVAAAMKTLAAATTAFRASKNTPYTFNGTIDPDTYYTLQLNETGSAKHSWYLSNPRDLAQNENDSYRPYAVLTENYDYTTCPWRIITSTTSNKYLLVSNLAANQYIDEEGRVRAGISFGDNDWNYKTLLQSTPTWGSSSSLIVKIDKNGDNFYHNPTTGIMARNTNLYAQYTLTKMAPVSTSEQSVKLRAMVVNNAIVVGSEKVEVYTITGMKIDNNNLKTGVYVAKAAGETFKVIIK